MKTIPPTNTRTARGIIPKLDEFVAWEITPNKSVPIKLAPFPNASNKEKSSPDLFLGMIWVK